MFCDHQGLSQSESKTCVYTPITTASAQNPLRARDSIHVESPWGEQITVCAGGRKIACVAIVVIRRARDNGNNCRFAIGLVFATIIFFADLYFVLKGERGQSGTMKESLVYLSNMAV